MRILLVDDHAIVRAGLRSLLTAALPAEIREAASGEEALALVQSARPDLVLLDLNLPGIGGLEVLRRLARERPAPRVLVLSMHADRVHAARALEAGAMGYLSKNAGPDEVRLAIRRVTEGGRYVEGAIAQEIALQGAASDPRDLLSGRDLDILRLLGEGRSMAEIADALSIRYKTVANACTRIKTRLGVARTADLIRLAVGAAPPQR